MKYILTALLFAMMFSSPSFAEWMKVAKNVNGAYYLDFERIRKHGDYINFRELIDLLEPDKDGDLSYILYQQGDCKLFRYKYLNSSTYKEPMGGGRESVYNKPDKDWRYPSPNSSIETVLKTVCNQ